MPRDFKNTWGGGLYLISRAPLYTENRERSAAAAVCVGMNRFLSSAGASSAPGKKPCGEPTCTIKVPVTSVYQCPCGRWMHGFCGRGIVGRKATGSKKSAQTARRSHLETRPAASAVQWKWMVMTRRRTAGEFLIQIYLVTFTRGCRGLNDADQATMLDVTEIVSQKWENFPNQTVIPEPDRHQVLAQGRHSSQGASKRPQGQGHTTRSRGQGGHGHH